MPHAIRSHDYETLLDQGADPYQVLDLVGALQALADAAPDLPVPQWHCTAGLSSPRFPYLQFTFDDGYIVLTVLSERQQGTKGFRVNLYDTQDLTAPRRSYWHQMDQLVDLCVRLSVYLP